MTDLFSFTIVITKNDRSKYGGRLWENPARFRRAEDGEVREFLARKEAAGDLFMSICPRGFVEGWIQSKLTTIPGLAYVKKGFVILGSAELKCALNDVERAFSIIREDDWSYFYLGGLSIEDALSADDNLLWTFADANTHDNPYYLISYLRTHRDIFRRALEKNAHVLYTVFD